MGASVAGRATESPSLMALKARIPSATSGWRPPEGVACFALLLQFIALPWLHWTFEPTLMRMPFRAPAGFFCVRHSHGINSPLCRTCAYQSPGGRVGLTTNGTDQKIRCPESPLCAPSMGVELLDSGSTPRSASPRQPRCPSCGGRRTRTAFARAGHLPDSVRDPDNGPESPQAGAAGFCLLGTGP